MFYLVSLAGLSEEKNSFTFTKQVEVGNLRFRTTIMVNVIFVLSVFTVAIVRCHNLQRLISDTFRQDLTPSTET